MEISFLSITSFLSLLLLFYFSCDVRISHVIFLSASCSSEKIIPGGRGSALLGLILKMSFSAPLGHVHSALCNGRLFQYIMSKNDTSPSPQQTVTLSPFLLPSSLLFPKLFFLASPSECVPNCLLDAGNTRREHGRRDVSSDAPMSCVYCVLVHLAETFLHKTKWFPLFYSAQKKIQFKLQ